MKEKSVFFLHVLFFKYLTQNSQHARAACLGVAVLTSFNCKQESNGKHQIPERGSALRASHKPDPRRRRRRRRRGCASICTVFSLIKQRHHFANKGPSSQSYGFSSSHVWI